jgi:hypothetical protein
MRMPDPAAAPGEADEKELRREKWEQLHPGDAGKVQRKCDACAEEEGEQLQRKASPDGAARGPQPRPPAEAIGGAVARTAAPAIVHDVLRSPGVPLDAATRAFMDLGSAWTSIGSGSIRAKKPRGRRRR